jgi:hypothetical protein
MAQDFSSIQNHILSKLKNARALRYGELMPGNENGKPSIPNDLFNYHLQFLVKKGYVTKAEDGYSLSESGVKHVADPVLFADSKLISTFKVNPITVVSRINKGQVEILNQVRHSHPSFGKVGVPGGIVWKGEELLEGAKRKFIEETGLSASFKLLGIERRMMYVAGELFSDVFFPIVYADEYEGELIDTEFGKNMWVPIDDAISNDKKDAFDCIEMIGNVLEAIKGGSVHEMPFKYEEVVKHGNKQP